MKLRNKKTGEIIDLEQWRFEFYEGSGCIAITNDKNQNEGFCYGTFADMKDEWEDYKPKEPLIKDEKIRKAVRAWAEAVGTECVEITHSRSHFIRFMSYLSDEDELCMTREIGQLFDEKLYTIAELCGEEK